MALVQNEYFKYDSDKHQYYMTEAGLAKYVTNGEQLVALWDAANRLKLQAGLVYRKYIKSAHNVNLERYRHKDLIEYRVFLNNYGEVDAIKEALINFAEVVNDSELDREILAGTAELPYSVLDPLSDANVYYRGHICDYVPEDEYRVGY